MSIHTLEENRFIEKLAGSTEVFNFQFYSCILSTFLFQRSGLEAETLSLKVPTCIFACRSKTNWIYLGRSSVTFYLSLLHKEYCTLNTKGKQIVIGSKSMSSIAHEISSGEWGSQCPKLCYFSNVTT